MLLACSGKAHVDILFRICCIPIDPTDSLLALSTNLLRRNVKFWEDLTLRLHLEQDMLEGKVGREMGKFVIIMHKISQITVRLDMQKS